MDLDKLKVRRSFIFTPGLNPEMFPKAIASGADMVCIELEDGIAMKDKDEARKNTIEALKSLEVKNDVELVVRLNCQRTKNGLLDLEAFISSKLKVKALIVAGRESWVRHTLFMYRPLQRCPYLGIYVLFLFFRYKQPFPKEQPIHDQQDFYRRFCGAGLRFLGRLRFYDRRLKAGMIVA